MTLCFVSQNTNFSDPVREVAERLGGEGLFVWDGNYYALVVTGRLGVEESGGMVRVGIARYNTAAEVDRLLSEVSGSARG